MPLLDHFHPPLSPRRHWESFHVNWAGAIADALNESLLPEGYFAEEHAQLGPRVEIDVATFTDSESPGRRARRERRPCLARWAPPAPAHGDARQRFPTPSKSWYSTTREGLDWWRPSSWSARATRIATGIVRRSRSSAPAICARGSASS